jgi:hypothetical protein
MIPVSVAGPLGSRENSPEVAGHDGFDEQGALHDGNQCEPRATSKTSPNPMPPLDFRSYRSQIFARSATCWPMSLRRPVSYVVGWNLRCSGGRSSDDAGQALAPSPYSTLPRGGGARPIEWAHGSTSKRFTTSGIEPPSHGFMAGYLKLVSHITR